MAFLVPSFEKIRTDLLRDLKNQLPEADVSTDSDFYVRATSVASAVEGLYQHQSWIVRQIFPDTADSEYLEMHAAIRGLTRKPAVAASGLIEITGTAGANIEAGLIAVDDDGRHYVVQEAGSIGEDGVITLFVAAEKVGAANNAGDNTPVKLRSAPQGVHVDAVLLTMRGGVERESDLELLARLLDIIRRPPAGGNKYDYRRWALEVPGVTGAFVYPLRRGLGKVDVVVTSGNGLPSAEILKAVQEHIDNVRPVTAWDCSVSAPAIRYVDIVVQVALLGVLLDEATPAIADAVNSPFIELEPGQTWVRSQTEALISNVPGVADRKIVMPSSNVVPDISGAEIEWLRLGDLTVELMP